MPDGDEIEQMQKFPANPRGDLIARYIYHYTASNGFVCPKDMVLYCCVKYNFLSGHMKKRESTQILQRSKRIWSFLMWLCLKHSLVLVTTVWSKQAILHRA